MFGFFKSRSKDSSITPQPVQQQTHMAPGTEIRYSPELVATLHDDHQELLGLYGKIEQAFKERRFVEVSSMLADFKSGLSAHLLTENVRLYIYLDRSLAHDPINSDLIRGFRKEMDEIAKVALGFLKKYETIGVDEDLAEHFATDFATIGKVLVERIKKEESTLYPLYMPQYS